MPESRMKRKRTGIRTRSKEEIGAGNNKEVRGRNSLGARAGKLWGMSVLFFAALTGSAFGGEREPAGRELLPDVLHKISRYCSARIEYQFGDQRELLDGNTIVEWILYDDITGTIHLNREKIQGYVAELAEKYDTYQKPRTFQTSVGDVVTVNGGSYGWLLDQKQETYMLEHLIRSGARRERTPEFAHTAAGWSHSDLGDTYVEIDLTNQQVWLYVDGVQEVASSCVSGTLTDSGRATPEGTYTISYTQSPAVLTGPDWNSPVSYWMPFNGGIGLHDASWRSSFGGDIYRYSGSHGCINLPYQAARTIYRYAYSGMPVICYYR